jgi:hypothetical protein
MTTIYRLIGRFMLRYWLVRYRRQIRITVGVATAIAVAAGYFAATRQPPEG